MRDALGETPGLPLVLAFVIVSYFSWALQFGYYRYAIPLEMLTGVIAMAMRDLACSWERRLRLGAAVAVTGLALTTTVYLDWGRRPLRRQILLMQVSVPVLPPDGIVLIATWDPAAYFIPYAEPRVQYLGIENNYLEPSQTNILAEEVKHLMRTPGPPKFVVSVGDFDAGKLNKPATGQFLILKLESGARRACQCARTWRTRRSAFARPSEGRYWGRAVPPLASP